MKYRKIKEGNILDSFVRTNSLFTIKDLAKHLKTSKYQVKKYLYILMDKGKVSRNKSGGGCVEVNYGDYESALWSCVPTPVVYYWKLECKKLVEIQKRLFNEREKRYGEQMDKFYKQQREEFGKNNN